MGEYLLGIDNGSTVSKAALFDLRGREIAVESCKDDFLLPYPGWTERDMSRLWASTADAIRNVLLKAQIAPKEIAGIGCTGHGNGLYLLDRQGQPLRNAILSMDTRAAAIVAKWNEQVHSQAFPFIIQKLWPAQPPALLAWMKENEPQNYERIGAVLFVKDYIKYRLTGEITTDFTDMSAASLMHVRQKSYAHELLVLYDLVDIFSALPPLKYCSEIVGRVTRAAAQDTGLVEGTPVVGGMFDVDGSAVGCGAVNPGQACIIAGTWSINEVITSQPIVDPNILQTTLFAAPELFLSIESSATSATNLEWFIAQCCGDERVEAERRGISIYEVCNEEVASLAPGSTSLIFHPFLYGSNIEPTARAGFYGIAGWHTRAHLLRALYEGVVFGHLVHIERLRAAGAQVESVRLAGGGSRSEVWTQIFADTLQLPMQISDGNELGARGAALSAGIGAGIYRDYAQAVEQAVSIARVQEPIATNTPSYLARYREYLRLAQAMSEPWEELNKLD